MNKDSKQMIGIESQRVIGIDIGDVKSHICELDKNTGEVVKRATLRTEMAALLGYFSARAKSLI